MEFTTNRTIQKLTSERNESPIVGLGIALYGMVWHGMVGVWNGMVWHVVVRVCYGKSWYGYGIVWHGRGIGMACNGKVWHSMAW